ncbi:hypothetical protein [Frigoriflavimonas asaccharolytica]|uniref:Uncharacterized protein n=1 Tax=Frigoriflavimonas asaccharolytica TaxID=2735899 RepID=A0A8J8K8A4_9FLAO|nr:hypothetical protein [Frigoriflavimonas asaccharolytica]NRS92793.1 hypothetical protein [Frigoriflavimonas asaccharolytica]
MKNSMIEVKKKLIEWIENLDDLEIVAELIELKNKSNQPLLVEESQAEYAIADDFDERFAKGYTMEESRKRTREFISNLPWKK